MAWIIDRCRELYNAGLEERREAYRMCQKSISYYDQAPQMASIREIRPEYAELDAHMVRQSLERLERAFKGFFSRLKTGQKAGYPRFKGRERYHSFTFYQNGWKITDGRLTMRGVGAVKVRWSRPIAGTIKTVTISRDADQWYVCFSCVVDAADPVPDASLPVVGIDMGIEYFATLSDGTHIANPRHLQTGRVLLTKRSQAMARKKRGSARRKRAKLLLAKAHRKIRDQRKDFHHKTARILVNTHSLIAVEALRTSNMIRRPAPQPATTEEDTIVYLPNGAASKAGLNKSIGDAGWGTFLELLRVKAEEAGCAVVAVNPAGTSQACSQCGAVAPKGLDVRWHHCVHCGCSLQRDVNAARNILARVGQTLQAGA